MHWRKGSLNSLALRVAFILILFTIKNMCALCVHHDVLCKYVLLYCQSINVDWYIQVKHES